MSWPQTLMSPESMRSSPFRQRSKVLLPDPLRPMIATIWPFCTSSETPFNTLFVPKLLCRLLMLTIADIQFPFKVLAQRRQRIAETKINQGHAAEHGERLERRVVDDLTGARQIDETDHRRQRSVLDDLHHETNGWWNRDLERLRQDHFVQLFETVEAQAFGGFPLRFRYRFDTTAPDLAEEGGAIHRKRNPGSDQRRQLEARNRQTEVGYEQDHQQRDALDDLDIPAGDGAQRLVGGYAPERNHETGYAAKDERHQRQGHGPDGCLQQVFDV